MERPTVYTLENYLLADKYEVVDDLLENTDDVHYIRELKHGHFIKLINTAVLKDVVSQCPDTSNESPENAIFCALIQNKNKFDSPDKQLELLCIGIASLYGFIQENWVGPSLLTGDCSIDLFSNCENVCEKIVQHLVLDGEEYVPCIQHLELLMCARAIFQACDKICDKLMSSKWWLQRCLFIHQQILDEFSPNLHAALMDLLKSSPQDISSNLLILWQLEAIQVHLYYRQVVRAKELLVKVQEAVGINIELTGALGKRTYHQERDIAQLSLKVNLSREAKTDKFYDVVEDFPKILQLDDDVRLDSVKFTDDSATALPALTATEEAVVLSLLMLTQKSQPKDKLSNEELMPYIELLRKQPRSWCFLMTTLYIQCNLECNHRRTVDRAMSQCQVLVDSIQASTPSVINRLYMFFASGMPLSYRFQMHLANIMFTLGAINSALDIYKSLNAWEETVACYIINELRHKAEEVIRSEIAKKKTIKLLCLLGDVTDDTTYYEEAWELSGHKSGLAQRHWGLYYFNRAKYSECLPHFTESLSINSLQSSIWSRLGFAALKCEDWEKCATAYRRYCQLDTDSFEAWNNLANAYIKLGEKARAWKALQEAIKCNYENWKVWDNYMAVSTDCAEYSEVIRAYHRILDLKGKHVDEEVLKILANAVGNDLPDNAGEPSGRLLNLAQALFGRLTSQVQTNSLVWKLYAQLVSSGKPTLENQQKVGQLLQRAYQAAVQKPSWDKDVQYSKDLLQLCITLADASIENAEQCPNNKQAIQMLSSGCLPVKSVVTKIKQTHTSLLTGTVHPDLSDLLQVLEEKQVTLTSMIQQRQT